MNELTFAYKDEAFTDSMILAKGTRVSHSSMIKLITNHKDDIETFGRVRFEIRPLETNGGVQKVKTCKLNEQQATFLISLMKNTKPVVEFKKELVKQFFEMREFIHELVTARHEFPMLTEQIKSAHENPKPYHYSNELDMINRIVIGMSARQFREKHGIEKGASIRPYLTAEQIEILERLQKVDVGLLISVPDLEQRKKMLTEYAERHTMNRLQVA